MERAEKRLIASYNAETRNILVNRINMVAYLSRFIAFASFVPAKTALRKHCVFLEFSARHELIFLEFSRERLRLECACGNYNSSACARVSDVVLQLVRRSVGAPTAHACAGDGSHHPEDISTGRSGPPGEFPGAVHGTRAGSCLRRPPD